MNILFVDQFGELGGAQQCLLDLMPAILDRGWRAFAAVPAGGALAARLGDLGVKLAIISPGNYKESNKSFGDALQFAWRTPIMASQLSRLCRTHRIDLMYVNGPRLLPAAALTSKSPPVLFHAHNYVSPGISRRLAQWSIRRACASVVSVSKFVGSYLGDSAAVQVIPNGVADQRRNRPTRNRPSIGIVGRIAPKKGHLLFIEAARILSAAIPDCRFVVCGEPMFARSGYAEDVRAKAEGLPVEFLGWRADIAPVLANLDLLVVPSPEDEGLGRVVLEAFSADLPVLAFRSGGIPELIEDGLTGYLVEERTPFALAARIEEVLGNPGGSLEVARKARMLWESRFTLEHYCREVTAAMIRAAARETAGPPTQPVSPL